MSSRIGFVFGIDRLEEKSEESFAIQTRRDRDSQMKESGRAGFVARSFVEDNARRWGRITPPLNGCVPFPALSFAKSNCVHFCESLVRISDSTLRESVSRDKGVARTTGEAKVLTTSYSRRDSPRIIRKVREDGFIFGAGVRVKSPRRIQRFRGIPFSPLLN